MVRTAVVWTDSGGAGKSTITMNVAHALERAGKRTLVWDIDPQKGSLTGHLGLVDHLVDDELTALDAVFDRARSLDDVILERGSEADLPFALIPSTLAWEGFDERLRNAEIANDWMLFRQAIAESSIPDRFDVMLIDSEGGRRLKERNALVAMQNVVLPVDPNLKGRNSVGSARDYVFNRTQAGLERSGINLPFSLLAVVPNSVKAGKGVHEQTVEMLQADESIPATPFALYNRGPYDAALERKQTLFQFAEDPNSRDLYDYEGEILDKYEALATIIIAGDVQATSTPARGVQ